MSVTYRAKAFIGCKVTRDRLFHTVKARGCDHAPLHSTLYCPHCGKLMWVDKKVPISQWDEEDDLSGLTLVHGMGDELYACVRYVVAEDSGIADKLMPLHEDSVAMTKRMLQVKLEPLGLWDESTFGLWSVLYCS